MFKLVLTRENKSATFEQIFDDYQTLSEKMTKLSHLFDAYFIYNLQTVNQNPH